MAHKKKAVSQRPMRQLTRGLLLQGLDDLLRDEMVFALF